MFDDVAMCAVILLVIYEFGRYSHAFLPKSRITPFDRTCGLHGIVDADVNVT